MMSNHKLNVKELIKNKRIKVGLGITFFTLIIIFSLIEPDITIPKKKDKKVADFEFENIKITLLSDKKTEWILNADKAFLYKNSDLSYLQNVKGEIFDKNKKQVLFNSITANIALENSDMILSQAHATILNNKRNITVSANTLLWNSNSKLFHGKDNTSIKTRGIILKGNEFKIDIPFKKLTLSQNGKATIKPYEIEKN